MFFFQSYGFPLSASFYQFFIYIFILKVCLFGGQTGKAGNFKQKMGSVKQKSTLSYTGFTSPACSVKLVEGFI
jgi:hypothetical protein